MLRNAVTRHSEGADSAADLWVAAAAADPSWDSMSGGGGVAADCAGILPDSELA